MGRKRGRPNPSPRHRFPSHPKRRRFPPPHTTTEFLDPPPTTRPPPPPAVVVIGLPSDLSILDLKSKFEIYGPISRIRLDSNVLGFITFRTLFAAESAVAAALDPDSGITVDSKRVQVVWDSGRGGSGGGGSEGRRLSSKLVRAERPLSSLGRGNRLSPAGGRGGGRGGNVVGRGFAGREIVAYDDIL